MMAAAVVAGFLAGLLGSVVVLYSIALRVRRLEDDREKAWKELAEAWGRIVRLEDATGTIPRPGLHILPPDSEGSDDV